MTNPNKLLRSYGTDDAKMIQFSRTTKINLENNLAEFTSFDPDMDASFVTNFETTIDAIASFSSDNQLIDVQVQSTLDLEEKMKECRDYFQNMKYFIEKSFPSKTGTWAEFGYNDYDRVRGRSDSMILFMHVLFEVSTKYEAILTAAGFDATRIAKIETLTEELRDAKSLQEQSKGLRSTAANDRVIKLNELYDLTTRICNAGKAIFYQDYGRHQLFVLPWKSSGASSKQPVILHGVVSSEETAFIDLPDLSKESVLVLTNKGSEPLRFHGENAPGVDSGGGIIIHPFDSQSVTFESISEDPTSATILNVSHNLSGPGSPEGSYEVSLTE